jgi:hypothetical protein
MQGRQDAWTIFREWKEKVPAFKDSYLISTGPYIGIRDTRRIIGVERLTVEDLQTNRRHDDAIATGCWFLDLHPRKTTTDKPFTGSAFQPLPYDIPYRTGVELSLSTLRRLGQHPQIRAIKDCGGDAGKTQQLIADGALQVLAGEDMQIFGTLAAGGSGAISASAHLRTDDFAAVVRLLQAGQLAQARRLWAPLVPLISALFAEPNPACTKSALAQVGLLENRLREPMQKASRPFDMRLLG